LKNLIFSFTPLRIWSIFRKNITYFNTQDHHSAMLSLAYFSIKYQRFCVKFGQNSGKVGGLPAAHFPLPNLAFGPFLGLRTIF